MNIFHAPALVFADETTAGPNFARTVKNSPFRADSVGISRDEIAPQEAGGNGALGISG